MRVSFSERVREGERYYGVCINAHECMSMCINTMSCIYMDM